MLAIVKNCKYICHMTDPVVYTFAICIRKNKIDGIAVHIYKCTKMWRFTELNVLVESAFLYQHIDKTSIMNIETNIFENSFPVSTFLNLKYPLMATHSMMKVFMAINEVGQLPAPHSRFIFQVLKGLTYKNRKNYCCTLWRMRATILQKFIFIKSQVQLCEQLVSQKATFMVMVRQAKPFDWGLVMILVMVTYWKWHEVRDRTYTQVFSVEACFPCSIWMSHYFLHWHKMFPEYKSMLQMKCILV